MNDETRARVPGEDVPVAVPGALLVLGLLFVSTAVGAANGAASPPVASRAAPAETSAPTPEPPPSPAATATAAIATANVASDPECRALVIRFANGATDGPDAAIAPLSKLARHLTATPDAHVIVEGHADAVGDEIYNLRLSRDRAAWVATKLRDVGVARQRLTLRGLGAFSPVAGVPETESANRRVVVVVRGGAACAPVPEEEIR